MHDASTHATRLSHVMHSRIITIHVFPPTVTTPGHPGIRSHVAGPTVSMWTPAFPNCSHLPDLAGKTNLQTSPVHLYTLHPAL
jgi:hypothetical protein